MNWWAREMKNTKVANPLSTALWAAPANWFHHPGFSDFSFNQTAFDLQARSHTHTQKKKKHLRSTKKPHNPVNLHFAFSSRGQTCSMLRPVCLSVFLSVSCSFALGTFWVELTWFLNCVRSPQKGSAFKNLFSNKQERAEKALDYYKQAATHFKLCKQCTPTFLPPLSEKWPPPKLRPRAARSFFSPSLFLFFQQKWWTHTHKKKN